MNRNSICLLLGLAVAAHTGAALAEVYRWVDKDGRVHFSDRKPGGATAADDITEQVSKTNIDSSAEQTKKLGEVFPQETEAERALQQQQDRARRDQQQQRAAACQRAHDLLKKLRGPVYLLDSGGQPYEISESERQRREDKLQAQIKQHCG